MKARHIMRQMWGHDYLLESDYSEDTRMNCTEAIQHEFSGFIYLAGGIEMIRNTAMLLYGSNAMKAYIRLSENAVTFRSHGNIVKVHRIITKYGLDAAMLALQELEKKQ